jgi:hypothetical protein
MPSYDYTEAPRDAWRERYPLNPAIVGVQTWYERADGPLRDLLRALQAERLRRPPPSAPCVFVSHRQPDTPRAKAVAVIARGKRFDTWVDVEDPNLAAVAAQRGWSQQDQDLAIACIIEMALLNCTHVVALVTVNAPGSNWIPYEYGRVKDRGALTTSQAACLVEPGAKRPIAEYFCLGEEIVGDPALSGWLGSERAKWP